jgi:peptidyl-prolyl cis-trans isomerase D
VLQQMRTNAKWIWLIVFVTFVGGFLLAESSGLLGRASVSTSTVVAKVNGQEIPYLTWANTAQSLAQQQEQSTGRGLTLDERRTVDDQAFNQLVSDVLLQQEYDKRGIRVTDAEIIEAAKFAPPPQFQQSPELQTDGRFDLAKYQRFLASPGARSQGLLAQLEAYYRTEIPKQKLFQQVAGDVFLSDTRLWQAWRDTHDSAQVSFVAFKPAVTKELRAKVTDGEMEKYFESHKQEFERQGRGIVSLVEISRRATAADSAETERKVEAIRAEILKGAKFEEVAKRESDDSVSGRDGGALGKGPKGRFVKAFEDAAGKLKVGELSQPVATQFGFHLIRLDERKGDTLTLHHILKLIRQGDSSATATDRRADQLAKLAASADQPAKFDSAAKTLGLLVTKVEVHEGEPASYLGRNIPSVSAWAFGGAHPGESSELYDDEKGYYLARLDSVQAGGVPTLARVKDEIRDAVAAEKAIDALVPAAKELAQAAATGTLEAAAQAKSMQVEKTGAFSRGTTVPALGVLSEAVGASFGLPVGAVSAPVKTREAVYVLRVDRRVEADRTKWEAQKAAQRDGMLRTLRQQRVQLFLDNLRKASKIDDRRKQIQVSQRRATT